MEKITNTGGEQVDDTKQTDIHLGRPGGDGCPTMRMYVTPLIRILKNGEDAECQRPGYAETRGEHVPPFEAHVLVFLSLMNPKSGCCTHSTRHQGGSWTRNREFKGKTVESGGECSLPLEGRRKQFVRKVGVGERRSARQSSAPGQ